MLRSSSRRKVTRVAIVTAASVFGGLSYKAAAADSPTIFSTGASDLSVGTNYSPAITPTAASAYDAEFSGTYSPATLNINAAALSFGTLNDLSATSLVITNSNATAGSITLSSPSNSVSSNASDLLYVATGSNLTINSSTGTNTLIFGSSGNVDSLGTLAINSAVNLGTGVVTFIGANASVGGVIANTTGSIDVNVTGAVTFSGANTTYASGINVSSGTVTVSNVSGLGTGTITLGNGTTLTATVNSVANTINIPTGDSATLNLPTSAGNYNGIFTGGGSLLIPTSSYLYSRTFSAVNDSAFTGTLIFQRGTNTFSGANANFSSTTISFAPSAADDSTYFDPTGTGTTQILNIANFINAQVNIGSSTILDVTGGSIGYGTTAQAYGTGGPIISGGSLTSASGLLTFSGMANASSRSITVSSALVNGSSGLLGVNMTGNYTLILSGANTYGGTTNVSNGILQIGAGGIGGSLGAGPLLDGTSVVFDNTGTSTYAGNISGSGIVTQLAGAMGLAGTNTYTGVTNISGGGLYFVNESSLYNGNQAAWNTSNITVASGATLGFGYGAPGEFTLTDIGTILSNFQGNGSTGLKTGSSFGLYIASGTVTYPNLLTNLANGGALGFGKAGPGTLTQTLDNTYTGPTTVGGGVLQAGIASTINGGPFGLNSAITTLNVAGATLDLDGYNVSVGSLAGGGTTGGGITLNSGNLTTGTNNAAASYAGIISGAGTFTKIGTGTQTLTGISTYTGTTYVGGGTLALTGNLTGTSGISVINSGGLSFTSTTTPTLTIPSLAITAGEGTFTATNTSNNAKIAFTSYAGRSTGSDVNFVYSTSNVSATSITLGGQAAGFIDQGTFFNGSNYTYMNSSGGYVRGIIYGTDAGAVTTAGGTSLSAATYQQFTASVTNQSTATFTTLQDPGANSFNISTGSVVTTNGILKTGGSTASFSGGSIQAAPNAELVIRTDTASDYINLSSAIIANGTNALTKTGAGTLNVSGGSANTYKGLTTVNAGTLENLDGATSNSFQSSSGIVVNSGATLEQYRTNAGGLITETVANPTTTLNNGSTLNVASSNGSVTFAFTNNFNINGNVTMGIVGGGYTNTLTSAGAISGSGNINLNGTSGSSRNFTFTGASPSYSGNWSVTSNATYLAAVSSGAANALGTGYFTINTNSSLGSTVSTGLNSLSGVILTSSSSTLTGPIGWNNSAATVSMAAGTFYVGTATSSTGNISIGSLTQTGGTVNVYASSTVGSPLNLAGAYNYSGGALALNFKTTPTVGGTFTIANYGTLIGSPAVTVSPLSRYSYTTSDGTGTNSSITVTQSGSNANLTWVGNVSNAWDVATTKNWSNGGTADYFYNFDNVTFDDTATTFAPNISSGTTVYPASMTFNNTINPYSVTGSGSIGGSGSLLKMGSNSLTISTANSFTGGTVLSNGTLIAATSTALGASGSTVTLGDVNTGSNNITLQANSGITLAYPIVVSNQPTGSVTVNITGTSSDYLTGSTILLNQNLVINNTNSNYSTSAYTGAALTTYSLGISSSVSGTGGLTITGGYTTDMYTGTDTYFGPTVINGNSLVELGNSVTSDPNSVYNITSGSMLLSYNLTAAKFGGLIGGGTLQGSTGTNVASLGYLNDSNDAFTGLIAGPWTLTKVGTGTQTFSGANTYTGSTNVSAGTLTGTGSTPFGAAANALIVGNPNNTSAGTAVVLNLSTTSPTTTGTLSGTIATPTSGTNTATINNGGQIFTVNQTAAGTYQGIIAGTGGFTQGGTSALTLSGNNTYTGVTTATAGTLTLSGNDSAATGGFIIGPGSAVVTNVNFSTGSVIGVASGNVVNIGVIPGGTSVSYVNQTLNDSGSVTNAGSLSIGRSGYLEINSGGTWNQSGPMSLQAVNNSGYGAFFYVNAGGAFNYSGSTPINLTPSIGTSANAGYANFAVTTGTFTTDQGFSDAANIQTAPSANSSGQAQIVLVNGGTIALSANIPQLTTTIGSPISIFVSNNSGGIINTNGFNTANSNLIANTSGAAGILTITGGGSVNLSGTNTYSGGTKVNASTLIVSNIAGSATGTGPVTLTTGSTLASGTIGAIGGSVNAATGTIIAPGGVNSSIGNLTVGGLTTVSGTAMDFSLGNSGTGSIITNGSQLTFALGTSGTVSISSGTQLGFFGTPVTGDDYRLIGDNISGGTVAAITLSNFVLPAAPAGDTYALSTSVDPHYIDLVVASAGPSSIFWTNASTDNQWNTTSLNFNNGTSTVAYSNTSNATLGAGDNVTFNDNNNGNYNVSIPATVSPTSVTINNNTSAYTFTGTGGIGGPGGLLKLGSNSLVLATSNSYAGGTNVSQGTLVLASAYAFPLNTRLTIAQAANVVVNNSTGTIFVPQLSALSNNGTIDLTNNGLIVHNGSIGAISAQVALAFAGGTWTGTNASSGVITSSMAAADTTHLTAVGIATGLSFFEASPVSTSDVLLKYTYYGDANLDGKVDGSDYSLIDNSYEMEGWGNGSPTTTISGWYNGDFNYDGVVDGSDYTLMDNAFNSQGAQLSAEIASPTAELAPSGGVSAVPEPTSLGLLGIGAIGLLGRRRRRL
jgi:fibronectin-binding autotransporter adhesin